MIKKKKCSTKTNLKMLQEGGKSYETKGPKGRVVKIKKSDEK